MIDKMDGKSMNIVESNIDKLKAIFPEVFNEDKVDFEKLQVILGENIDTNLLEKYQMNWVGKMEAIKIAQQQSTGTLRPCKEDSKNWDTTKNIYIEGDNLEFLKLLQASYQNSIKMIYIDPPYNTGNDFVYKDNFADNIENYKEITGQATKTNPETAGRYHTNWLNMIYPRLKLAKSLLTEDGIICISIDEHEISNLKKVCDEIYGEDNFVGEIIRKTKSMTADNGTGFNLQHEQLLIYGKTKENVLMIGQEKTFDGYQNPDNDPNGDWCSADPSAKSGGPSTYFEIVNPYTLKADLPPKGRYWAFSKQTLENYIKTGKIVFKKSYKETERGFVFKRYKKDATTLNNPVNSLFIENQYMNQAATTELNDIFGNTYFSYPKPVNFIKDLIKANTNEGDIVLDFFSGSATTAHATLYNNSLDNKNRTFIMVQLPELMEQTSAAYKDGYKNLCEVGKERIRRAEDYIKSHSKATLKFKDKESAVKFYTENYNSDLDIDDITVYSYGYSRKIDYGFKVFKLDSSNIKKWDTTPTEDVSQLQMRITEQLDYIKDDRTDLDLVYEIMLKAGLTLDLQVEEKVVEGVKLYVVNNPEFKVGICLDKELTLEAVEKMLSDLDVIGTFIFAENCFKDANQKINTSEILKREDRKMRVF